MTVCSTSEYFFGGFIPSDIETFDIKTYLYFLSIGKYEMVSEYRLKYGNVEEKFVDLWIEALMPYFNVNKYDAPMTVSTQNELYIEQKNAINSSTYLEEDSNNWTGEPKTLKAFHLCLQSISDEAYIIMKLNKILPMVFQVLDDYRVKFKVIGVKLAREIVRILSVEKLSRFNLQMVFYESLKANLTFDSDELIESSLNAWIEIIKKTEKFPEAEFLQRSDELLLLLCRDVTITSKINKKTILLRGIGDVVEMMQYTAIRFLRKIVVTLCEAVREDFTSSEIITAGRESMAHVIKNCWIRMNSQELQELILCTFGGDEEIEHLLKEVGNSTIVK